MIERGAIGIYAIELIGKLKARNAGVCAAELQAALDDYRATHTAADYDRVYNLIGKFKDMMAGAGAVA